MKSTSIIGLGLVCFVLLAILTIVLAGGWIEDDLTARANDDLKAVGGLEWASVTLDGRDATLSGNAPDADSAKKALDVVAEVWGIRVVNDETVKP